MIAYESKVASPVDNALAKVLSSLRVGDDSPVRICGEQSSPRMIYGDHNIAVTGEVFVEI